MESGESVLGKGSWMTVYHRQGDGASSRIFRDRSSSRAQQCPLLTRMSYYISEKETKGPEGVCV